MLRLVSTRVPTGNLKSGTAVRRYAPSVVGELLPAFTLGPNTVDLPWLAHLAASAKITTTAPLEIHFLPLPFLRADINLAFSRRSASRRSSTLALVTLVRGRRIGFIVPRKPIFARLRPRLIVAVTHIVSSPETNVPNCLCAINCKSAPFPTFAPYYLAEQGYTP
jgi:hypothetical protein